ncbi:MAG: hypothetical protein LBB23_03960 [Rickettsiales bacterium]|jgi:hypothetical protein|nr:hypothetical protein [Rickettsiales bacterium]
MKKYLFIASFLFAGVAATAEMLNAEEQVLCEDGACSAYDMENPELVGQCPDESYEYGEECIDSKRAYGMAGLDCELPGADMDAGTTGKLQVVESRKIVECIRLM